MKQPYEKRELTVTQLGQAFGISRVGASKRLEKWLSEGFPGGWSSDKFGGRHRVKGLFIDGIPVFLKDRVPVEFPPRRKYYESPRAT